MKNLKTGEKGRATTKTGIAILSAGSSENELKTGMQHTTGYKVGTKNIPALFWNEMLLSNGQKEIEEKKMIGSKND